jgi:hypothetical protein
MGSGYGDMGNGAAFGDDVDLGHVGDLADAARIRDTTGVGRAMGHPVDWRTGNYVRLVSRRYRRSCRMGDDQPNRVRFDSADRRVGIVELAGAFTVGYMAGVARE